MTLILGYKVSVDKEACIGCSGCCSSGVFEMDSDGKACVTLYDVANIGEVKDAVEFCPVKAISCEKK